MDLFDEWQQKINEAKIDSSLQTEVADKILELLEQKKDSGSAWHPMLFAQAITGLSINVNSIYQPTETGLKECLIALRKVVGTEERSADLVTPIDHLSELISYGKLVATVENIKKQIG